MKEKQKLKLHKIHQLTVLGLTLTIFLTLFSSTALGRDRSGKFLILHLDAVSSEDFFEELESGRLPNIAELFENGQKVRSGLTLYPGGTELIMTRINEGMDNSQGHVVGWGYLDGETGEKKTTVPVFLEMLSGFNRRSRSQFVLGLQGLHHLAGLSLLNIDRIWETENVVEFFWFNSDVRGHFGGRDYHLRSIHTFDYYLGLAARAGKLQGANLVLYCDHGMTTEGVETVRYDELVKQIVQDDLQFFSYPNIYLLEQDRKEQLAKELAMETAIDVALIRVSENLVRGYTSCGSFEITHQDATYAYDFVGEDYFGYSQLGYTGELWSRDEWLKQTIGHTYPAVPPNVFNYLSNPSVGDIVALLNPPQIPYSLPARKGNHAGLQKSDLVVPLLLAGPAFESLPPIEEFWLHELYTVHLPMIDIHERERRESHMVSLAYPGSLEITLSPAYRWRVGLNISEGRFAPWLEHDVYSSFLTRVWVGAHYADERLGWQVRVEGFLGDVGVSWLKKSEQAGQLRFHWRFTDQGEVFASKGMVGVSLIL